MVPLTLMLTGAVPLSTGSPRANVSGFGPVLAVPSLRTMSLPDFSKPSDPVREIEPIPIVAESMRIRPAWERGRRDSPWLLNSTVTPVAVKLIPSSPMTPTSPVTLSDCQPPVVPAAL